MSHSIKLVLPDPAKAQLDHMAVATGMRVATLASRLLQGAITQAADSGTPAPPPPVVRSHQGSERAPWLEPYGNDEGWRLQTWSAVVALHGRYPRALEYVKSNWWNDEAQVEMLAALAHWRQELDDTATDPRQELAFHAQLHDYTHFLRHDPSGTSNRWEPGAPPEDWLPHS